MHHSVQFGSKEIRFKLERSERKSLGITINPDLTVIVNAPESAPLEKIKEKVIKRAPWIIKQENFFLTFHPKTPARKYVSGESHLFLGREFVLRIKEGGKNEVHRKRNSIDLTVRKKGNAKKTLEQWYRHHAKIVFGELAKIQIDRFKSYGVRPKGITIKKMQTRWGSCTPKRMIILNPELIKAPRRCIEYVIIHELCHLVHRDHTQKFFELQKRMMPDWVKWKMKLEKILA